MNTKPSAYLLAVASLTLSILACKFLTNGPLGPPKSNEQEGSTTVIQETDAIPPTRSPLNQVALDLSTLASFQADLHITAKGTIGDQSYQRDYSMRYVVSANPDMTVVTIETIGSGNGEYHSSTVYAKSTARAVGRMSPQDACKPLGAEMEKFVFLPPGTLLPDLSSAQPNGQDTFAGMAVDRFTVSDSKAGLEGQVRQAKAGGPVLQFTATQNGSLPMFGQEAKGQAQWEYALSNIGQAAAPDLPPACRHLLGEMPFPPDVQDLTGRDDFVTFTTHQSLTELITFYREALEKEGWTSIMQPTMSDRIAGLNYSHETIALNIAAQRAGNLTVVTIFFNE